MERKTLNPHVDMSSSCYVSDEGAEVLIFLFRMTWINIYKGKATESGYFLCFLISFFNQRIMLLHLLKEHEAVVLFVWWKGHISLILCFL